MKELQAKFLEEAKKYQMLPLDDRSAERLDPANRIVGVKRTSWTYGNGARMPEAAGPKIWPFSHTITADLTIGAGSQGVITCAGGSGGGWRLYVLNGRLVYAINF